MNKPTKGPWKRAGREPERHAVRIVNKDGMLVAEARAAGGPWFEADGNALLIIAAVNSCFQINPDNPLAVAEALPELVEAARDLWLKTALIPVDWKNPEAKELSANAVQSMDAVHAALAKIGAK